jgi:hypothetical protein
VNVHSIDYPRLTCVDRNADADLTTSNSARIKHFTMGAKIFFGPGPKFEVLTEELLF